MAVRRERISDILWSLFAMAIVAAGIAGYVVLGKLRTPLAAVDIERRVPVVETIALALHGAPLPIRGTGFLRPVRQLTLAVESSGRIVDMHPALSSHGSVRAGEVLLKLDARRAEAALRRANADIDSTRARLELNAMQLERAEKLREQRVISQDELDQRLAEEAELSAALNSLQSIRESAELALENTEVRAPFDADVLSRQVELGAVVSIGQPLAELFTSEALEVTVPLIEQSAALIPDLFSGTDARALVTTHFAERPITHPAHIVRVARALGEGTRLLDVTVALEPELNPEIGSTSPARALIDSYTDVVIDGVVVDDIHAVPATAVRADDTIWLVANNRFAIRRAESVHRDRDTAFVHIEDLPGEARLVTGVVDTPIDGMTVRTLDALSTTLPVDADAAALDADLAVDR